MLYIAYINGHNSLRGHIMPQGPLGAPRLTNIGPISRPTKEEIRKEWKECSVTEYRGTQLFDKQIEICTEVKNASIEVLENQGIYAQFNSPEEINTGACHTVAKKVTDELDYTNWKMTAAKGHSWVEYDNNNYDSEVPNGVPDPFDLPTIARVGKEKYMRGTAKQMDNKPQKPRDIIIEPSDEFKQMVERNSC